MITSPLIGATAGNAFCIEEVVRDHPHRGRYRGTSPDGEAVVFSTCQATNRKANKLRTRLEYRHSGICRMYGIGPLQGVASDLMALVEQEPEGRPVGDWPKANFDRASVLWLGIRLADVIATAHKEDIILGGVRPELVYATLHLLR